MCLVAFSWKTHEEFPLILSANRDEFFDRPTAPLHRWENGLIAGKDLRGGGTWMGFTPEGKWALITNYRDFTRTQKGEISRGKLVQDFLEGNLTPESYLKSIFPEKDRYEGFNLLVSDGERLFYLSNYGNEVREIPPGIHGLSNGSINDPWPKVQLAKRQLENLLSSEINEKKLLEILKSTDTHPIDFLPRTGVPEPMEIQLSAQLIRMEPNYGTVSSSAVLCDRKGETLVKERSFHWDPGYYRDHTIRFHSFKP